MISCLWIFSLFLAVQLKANYTSYLDLALFFFKKNTKKSHTYRCDSFQLLE